MHVVAHKASAVGHAGAQHAILHYFFFYQIDTIQILIHGIPLDVARIVVVIVIAGAQWRAVERLPVDVAHCTFVAREISAGNAVVAALMYFQSAARRRIDIVVVVLVEAVPPVEVVLGQVGFAGFAGSRPGSGHQQVAFHSRKGAKSPAGAALLIFYAGDVVYAIHVAQVKSSRLTKASQHTA